MSCRHQADIFAFFLELLINDYFLKRVNGSSSAYMCTMWVCEWNLSVEVVKRACIVCTHSAGREWICAR